MQKDSIYLVQVYVNRPNHEYTCVCSNLGLFFSNNKVVDYSDADTLSYIPQVENVDDNFMTDTLNWMKLEWEFKAAGGEKFMTVGNFRPNATSIVQGCANTTGASYIYVDDFAVYLKSEYLADSIKKVNDSLQYIADSLKALQVLIDLPTAFTPNGDGKNDEFKLLGTPQNISNLTFCIFNRWEKEYFATPISTMVGMVLIKESPVR